MKIALQAGAPDQQHLAAFMQDLVQGGIKAEDPLPGAGNDVIAAYDDDKLVGLGGWISGGTAEQPKLQFYIAPGYEARMLPDHMKKLLLSKVKSGIS